MRRFHSPTLATIAALTVGISFLSAADEAPTIEQRLQALDQEVKILKRKAEIEAENAAAKAVTAKDAPKFTANAKDGFSLSSADGAYRLRIGGSAQIEGVFYLNDEDVPQTNTFFVRRVRPSFEGTVAKHFDYQLVLDFSPASPSAAVNTVLDANVTANIDPSFKLKVGRFKVPFGLEFLQSDPVTSFIERGLPSQLVPQRDTGIQAGGELLSGVLNYQVGIFNGANDRADNNADAAPDDDKEAAARLYAAPFKNTDLGILQGLNLGIAATYGHVQGTAAGGKPTYQSPGANQFFAYLPTAFLDGERIRYSPQLYYSFGPLDVLAEYVSSSAEVRLAAAGTRREITNTAWQVESGFVLTGEDATFRGVSPAGGGIGAAGWGALQLVARVAQLEVDDSVFDDGPAFAARNASASSAFNVGVGLNWYLNRNLKVALNYDHTTFEDGAGAPGAAVDKEDEDVIRSRLQLVF